MIIDCGIWLIIWFFSSNDSAETDQFTAPAPALPFSVPLKGFSLAHHALTRTPFRVGLYAPTPRR